MISKIKIFKSHLYRDENIVDLYMREFPSDNSQELVSFGRYSDTEMLFQVPSGNTIAVTKSKRKVWA